MKLKEILETLETDCGSAALQADEDGVYSLNHEGTELQIFPLEEGARALLYASVSEVPETGAAQLAKLTLEANHRFEGGKGASFAIDPEANAFCLQQLIDCESLGYEGAAAALLTFIDEAKRWKVKIEQFVPQASQQSDESDSSLTEPLSIPNNWLSI